MQAPTTEPSTTKVQRDQTRTTGHSRDSKRVQRHALGSTNHGLYRSQIPNTGCSRSDIRQVYRWRLLLEEYGPTIVYIKGIHNTVVDTISRLDYGPVQEDRSTMMTFAQCWCRYTSGQEENTSQSASTQESMNLMFANQDDEEAIYPLATGEIAEAQKHDIKHIQQKQLYFDKLSATVRTLVNRTWFSRYPHSQYIIYNNGSEFKLHFETLRDEYRVTRKPTSIKNPQANAICERMHQTVGNVLRTLLHGEPPKTFTKAKDFIDEALSISMHAMRAGMHSTLGSSPGSLVFNRDMFLNIPLIVDWHAITKRCEHLINENLMQKKNAGDVLTICLIKKY